MTTTGDARLMLAKDGAVSSTAASVDFLRRERMFSAVYGRSDRGRRGGVTLGSMRS